MRDIPVIVASDATRAAVSSAFPVLRALRDALADGGVLCAALRSCSSGERLLGQDELKSVLSSVLAVRYSHACVCADDIWLGWRDPRAGALPCDVVVVHSSPSKWTKYESVYNARGDVQTAYSLASSALACMGEPARGALCLNMKCFAQLAAVNHGGDGVRVHEAPVSSGATAEVAREILRSPDPQGIRIRSPPDVESFIPREEVTRRRGSELLEEIQAEQWPEGVKAQARREVAIAVCKQRKGKGGLTEADVIPEWHRMWADHSLAYSFASKSPRHPPRNIFHPSTPDRR